MVEYFELANSGAPPDGIIKRIVRDLMLNEAQGDALKRGLQFRADIFRGRQTEGFSDSELRAKILSAVSALHAASVVVTSLPFMAREHLIEGYGQAESVRGLSIDRQQARALEQADTAALARLSDAAQWAFNMMQGDTPGPAKSDKTIAASIAIELLSTVLDRAVIFGKPGTKNREFRACRQIMSWLLPDLALEDCDAPLRTAFRHRSPTPNREDR
jgi:hypothetical protein